MKRSFVITMLILAALAGFIIDARVRPAQLSPGYLAKGGIASFKTALSVFKVDHGRFPTKAESLEALIDRPATIPEGGKWHRYLDADKLPNDPWGRRYVYEIPGKHNPDGYDVYSLGPHGKGGAEAIGNWRPPPDVNR
jgi:general secretion pathway protein G